MTVIAVTSLLLEARIATGPGVSVICGHASQLVSCLQAAIKRGASGVISFGVAGGLAPHLAPGDWVIGSGVRTAHGRNGGRHGVPCRGQGGRPAQYSICRLSHGY